MATVRKSIAHVVRTSNDPRQTGLHNVTLSHIQQINPTIRLLRLSLPKEEPPLRHLPGQYVDLHIPNLAQVGGFTITSPPSTALPRATPATKSSPESEIGSGKPYIELAIQKSSNPPAQHLWQPASSILHTGFSLCVGGAFVYPPPALSKAQCEAITRVLLVAGGVGINPIMSIFSALHDLGNRGRIGTGLGMPHSVRVLYGTKWSGEDRTLFYDRIKGIVEYWQQQNSKKNNVQVSLDVYQTSASGATVDDLSTEKDCAKDDDAHHHQQQIAKSGSGAAAVRHHRRRMTTADLLAALGPTEDDGGSRSNTVAYVCGVPRMTDEFVAFLQRQEGMDEKRVLCEKWW